MMNLYLIALLIDHEILLRWFSLEGILLVHVISGSVRGQIGQKERQDISQIQMISANRVFVEDHPENSRDRHLPVSHQKKQEIDGEQL